MEAPSEEEKARQKEFSEWSIRLYRYAAAVARGRKEMKEFKVGDKARFAHREGTIVRMNTEQGTVVVDFNGRGELEVFPEELNKIDDTVVNPAHYQVEGIPEAIEIMSHLMTKEQFEGFLWGNIIKYVYRYGRKGDKKETAGKIAWYAKKLGEVMKVEG